MKERPILFNDEMVRAILDERKTQTRRVVKLTGNGLAVLRRPCATWIRDGIGLTWRPYGGAPEQPMPPEEVAKHCPHGGIGQKLWLREAWSHTGSGVWQVGDVAKAQDGQVIYRATHEGASAKWWPSIHMPRWASRLTLEITGVRVERVQDISEEEAKAEGAPVPMGRLGSYPAPWRNAVPGPRTFKETYQKLWDSLYDKKPGQSWADNPWVWAISFKRVQP